MSLAYKNKNIDFLPDASISEKIKKISENNQIACSSAFKLSEELSLTKEEVGQYADYLEIRLVKCQIGLFGHGPGTKLLKKLEFVDPGIETLVREHMENSILTCKNVFRIASELNISRIHVGSVCETLGIKVKQCRLGAF